MLKDKQSIQVTIRVRPLSQKQKNQDSRICVNVQEQTRSLSTFFAAQTKKFTFDSICDNNSQQDMFQKVGKKSTVYCLQGYNCTIFAYGQTGSGKTFTMMGTTQQSDNYQSMRGLIPRTLQYLFQSIDEEMKQTGSKYLINCSFLQIYNEQIIDLLNKNNSNLQIREDIRKGVYVEGVTQQTIQKGQQALDILNKGSKGRHVGSTCYNETSSRSHSVFTMQIQSKHQKNGIVNTKVRHFHFIDLAGSERTKQINGDRLKQGCSINKSLHVLGKVINSLAESSQSKPKHINYRDSKLTFLLKDSLGGNSKTHLIANISPCTMSYNETNMTLAFARRVKLIKINKASINQDATGNLQSLKNQIKRLKQEIILLRNGQINSLQISRRSQRGQTNSDTKMALILNQYVSEEIERQTKFQIQVAKLNKKVQNLQTAIQRYSQNQIQLRLIAKIYQDKIKRLKQVQKQIQERANFSGQNKSMMVQNGDSNTTVLDYIQNQRKLLITQLQSYKKLSSNQTMIKNFLKSLKIVDNDANLLQILMKNGQFLIELKGQLQKLQSLKPEHIFSQNQEIIQSKFQEMQLQYSKKQSYYMQKIQQLEQRIVQVKTVGQENENLLKEAVDHQINLEQNNKQLQIQILGLKSQIQQSHQKIKCFILKQQENSEEISNKKKVNSNLQITLKSKQKIIQQLTLKQIETIEQLKNTTNNKMLCKQRQISLLRQQNMTAETKVKQLQKDIFGLTLKMTDLQSSNNILLGLEQNYKNEIKDLLQKLQVHKCSQSEFDKLIEQVKMQNQNVNYQLATKSQAIQDLNNKLQNQQTIIQVSQQQTKNAKRAVHDLEQRIKYQQNQITTLKQKTYQTQKNQNQLKIEVKNLEIALQTKQSFIVEQQKCSKQKVNQLMNMIESMQNTDHENHQQINIIKISLIKLKQAKQELQFKTSCQIERANNKIIQINELNGNLLLKVKQKQQQNKQDKQKLSQIKRQLISARQSIRQSEFQLEQCKSDNNKLKVKLQNLNEEKALLLQKQKTSKHELIQVQKQLQQTKNQVKNMENQFYIKQKTNTFQKQTFQKQIKLKQQKWQNHLKQFQQFKINNIKQSQAYKIQIKSLKQNCQSQINIYLKNQQSLKQSLDQILTKKQSQILQLKQKVDQTQSKLNISNLKCKQLQEQVQYCKLSQKQLTAKINNLQQNRQKIITNLQQKIQNSQQMKNRLEELKNKHENQTQEIEEEHNNQIDNKNQKIQQLNSKTQLLSSQINKLECQIIKLECQIIKLECQNKRINKLLEQNQENLILSQNNIQILTKQSLKAQKKIQFYEKQNNMQKNQLIILQDKVQNIQKQLHKKQRQTVQLKQTFQNQLRQKQQIISQTSQSSTLFGQKHKQFQTQIHLIKKQNQKLTEQLLQKQKIISEGEQKQLQIAELILQKQMAYEQLKQQLSQKKLQIQSILVRQNQLKQLNHSQQAKYQEYVARCYQQINSRKAQLFQYIQRIKFCTQQNQQIKEQKRILQSMIESKSIQLQHLQQQIIKISQNDDQKKNNLKQLENQICTYQIRLQQEKQRFQTTFNNLKQNAQNLSQAMEQIQSFKRLRIEDIQELQKNKQQSQNLQNKLTQTEERLQKIKMQNSQYKLKQQSYTSLQAINNSLGQKCQQLLNQCQQAKKIKAQLIQIKRQFCNEKNKNVSLKTLIQNTQCQKRQLILQLQQKNQFYNELLQKLAKNQNQAKRVSNSEHYVKTVELLQKSRHQQVQLKKLYEQAKKQNLRLKDQLNKKQDQIEQIKQKTEQYCRTISQRNQDTEKDYMELQKRYEQIYKDKKVLQKVLIQNQSLKNANSKATLKISQLEQRLRNSDITYIQIQNQVKQYKKKCLHSGNIDEKTTTYINKLKTQINDLKKYKQSYHDSLQKETNEKLKLKTQIRYGNQTFTNAQSQIKCELDKKLNQVKYLQQIISETLQACKIKKIQPKSKLETIKSSILNCIQDNIRQNEQLKKRISQLQDEISFKEIKNNFQKNEHLSKDHRQKSNSMFTSLHQKYKNQNMQKYKHQNQQNSKQSLQLQNVKMYNMKQDPLCNIIRTKINKTQSKYSQIRQSVDQTALKSRDPINNRQVNRFYHE